MKKLLLVVSLVIGFISGAWAENTYNLPSGYKLLNSNPGLKAYIKNDGNILVVLAKTLGSKIRFSVGDEGSTYNGHRTYKRISIRDHYDNNDYGHLYMAINGQFFGWRSYTPLSFGVKKDYDILQNKILESEKNKKALAIIKGKYPIFFNGSGDELKKQKQIQNLLNKDYVSDAIVGLDPFDIDVKNAFGANSFKGRNMIGCIPYKKYDKDVLAVCRYTIFFVAKKSSFSSLINEINKWGVKSNYILNLDGSGSAQAYSRDVQNNYKNLWFKGDNRLLPNAILLSPN